MGVSLDNITKPSQIKQYSVEELESLASEIRRFLLDSVSETGGHIGANLGVIELTIAMHACFDSPTDRFLFDTGHQGYTHKLLTGRKKLFTSLNTYGGMNRFVTPTESEHDAVESSHAGTSVSVGLGIALANKLKNSDAYVVSLVGDSALAEGICLEALNHALVEDVRLVIVINDNGYAISPGFGAIHNALQSQDGKAKQLFESLGANYVGPVDGHNIQDLLTAFKKTRQLSGVTIVHAKTRKGKGWLPADGHPFRMHFSFPFDKQSGEAKSAVSAVPPYPDVVAEVVEQYMAEHQDTVCITPSTLYATGLTRVFKKFPERCFDPGMEEQHALSMCVGFSLQGILPIIAYQSTFLQRAFDQIIHDIAFANRPCLILSFRSGFSGYDNPTHHGIYDIAYLKPVPNLKIFYPKDKYEAQAMTRYCLHTIDGPTLIMMPYGPVDEIDSQVAENADLLNPEVMRDGDDVAIIAVGNKVRQSMLAADLLQAEGVSVRLINLRKIKPFPEDKIMESVGACKKVLVVEEAVASGGVGESMAATIAKQTDKNISFVHKALPTAFIEAGSNQELEEKYGLSASGIAKTILDKWF